jgi:hypothetical protein
MGERVEVDALDHPRLGAYLSCSGSGRGRGSSSSSSGNKGREDKRFYELRTYIARERSKRA